MSLWRSPVRGSSWANQHSMGWPYVFSMDGKYDAGPWTFSLIGAVRATLAFAPLAAAFASFVADYDAPGQEQSLHNAFHDFEAGVLGEVNPQDRGTPAS